MIVGVDPGTTVGWAVVDVDGNVVELGSKRECSLDELVSLLSRYDVVLVGTDKAKIPHFVQEFATKVGAKVIAPVFDVRVDEKRELAGSFGKNAHEMDAAASALMAFRKVQPLVRRIRAVLSKEDKMGVFSKVVEKVIHEEISIKAALLLSVPRVEIKKEVVEEEKRDEDIVRLFSLLSQSRKDTVVLKKRNDMLEKETAALRRHLVELKERMSGLVKPKAPEVAVRQKESRIQSLTAKAENAAGVQSELKQKIALLERVLLSKEFIALPRLRRLGWEDVKNALILDSAMYVDDANEMSQKAVDFLAQKGVNVVVCGVLPSQRARENLPFACVKGDAQIANKIALVKKEWLEAVRAEKQVLEKVILEYKKTRPS